MIILKTDQLSILESKLQRSGVRLESKSYPNKAYNRIFYNILSDMGFVDNRSPGKRAIPPNYEELGFDRVAGPPDATDIEQYKYVTNGGDLTDNGLVTQALLFDNDLITDRYHVATLNLLMDLYNQYLGRANDFNHKFDVTQARCRIIDMGMGSDPNCQMHSDVPVDSLTRLSPSNIVAGTYTALYATLAFPEYPNDPQNIIQSVKSGLIQDLSLSFFTADKCTYCSVCLEPMSPFWFWYYCENHGFPGGQTQSGERVVAIMDRADDALTFGLVSDGAVKRAGIILDPFYDGEDPEDIIDNGSEISDNEVQFWIKQLEIELGEHLDTDYIAQIFGRADWNDAAFAVIEKGAKKIDGKSTPDSLRHLPHHSGSATDGKSDKTVKLNLLRNALARMNQIKAHSGDSTARIRKVAKAHLVAHAKRLLPDTKYGVTPPKIEGESKSNEN